MISLDDVWLARSMGCTTAAQQSENVAGTPDGTFVTYRRRNCGQPALWLCEWQDINAAGRAESMLGAACAEHHEAIVSGEWPLFDSRHELVKPDWYRLPLHPAGDEEWVAQLVAAVEREDHAMDDIEVPEQVGAHDKLEVHRGEDGQWYFRRRAHNGEKLAGGEGYTRREDAVIGARRAFPDLADRVELVDE